MGLRRQAALDAARPWLLLAGDVASHDVETAAEVFTGATDEDHAHGLVAAGSVDGVDHGRDHRVVEGVALLGSVEQEAKNAALVELGTQPGDGRVAHVAANRSTRASSVS